MKKRKRDRVKEIVVTEKVIFIICIVAYIAYIKW